jgi:AraC-like DNA-binding protein
VADANETGIVRWTTDDVHPTERFDYYAHVLSTTQTPMSVFSESPKSFAADMVMAGLGPISVMRQTGSGNGARRTRRDIEHSSERTFHLLISLTADWTMTHRGPLRLRPGEAVIFDSDLEYELNIPCAYEFVHLKFTDAWMRQWLPSPGVLVGRAIPADAGWGRALTAFALQLSPGQAANAPVPTSVLMDQIGSLLVLAAPETMGRAPASAPATRALRARVHDVVTQRSHEISFSAGDVAAQLEISVRTLHRCLATSGETFGGMLMAARVGSAMRMLESPIFNRLTAGEIGRRAGFSDPSHFVRTMRAHVGRTPSQIRRGPEAGAGLTSLPAQ